MLTGIYKSKKQIQNQKICDLIERYGNRIIIIMNLGLCFLLNGYQNVVK